MAAEGWHDGTWNDPGLENPRSPKFLRFIDTSSVATFRLGQTRVGYHGIRPVDTTSKDPRQYGGERAEVVPSLDEVVCLVGGRAGWTPAKAKPKKRGMSGAGDSRRDQMSLRQQLRRRESASTSHREMPMLTAIPRAGALQEVVPLHQRQPGAYSAQGVEALDANAVSDDGLETEYQEAVALTTLVKQCRGGETSVFWRPQG